MKTTAFGVSSFLMVVITLIIVAEINLGGARRSLLEDNLNDGMSAALSTAFDERSYSINSEDELVTDVIEYLSLYLVEDSSVDVEIIGADLAKGILSLKVTQYFNTVFGKTDSISVTRTVLLEDKPIDLPDSYTIKYIIRDLSGVDVLFKKYTLQEGNTILYPSTSNYNMQIRGWSMSPGGTIMSKTDIQSLPLDKDYVFYAVF